MDTVASPGAPCGLGDTRAKLGRSPSALLLEQQKEIRREMEAGQKATEAKAKADLEKLREEMTPPEPAPADFGRASADLEPLPFEEPAAPSKPPAARPLMGEATLKLFYQDAGSYAQAEFSGTYVHEEGDASSTNPADLYFSPDDRTLKTNGQCSHVESVGEGY